MDEILVGKIRSSSKDGVNGKFDTVKIIHTEENRMSSLIIWMDSAKRGGNIPVLGSHSTWKTWKNKGTPGKPGNIMEF